jgi:succinate dehydrogenase / fumarate reductase iron-sulfur subunit
MNYQLNILRGTGAGEDHWQCFYSRLSDRDTVASALEELNSRERLQDVDGVDAEPIAWQCACLEKKCGACAMVISGKLRLACSTTLAEAADKNGVVTLEPLRKFPRVRDLQVERGSIAENLREMELWLENDAPTPTPGRAALHYDAARCILCGLCLEVCPNFDGRRAFTGALSALAAFRALDQSEKGEHREHIRQSYKKRFYGGCSKSLACQDICPAGINIERLLARTNAAAIWRRKER